MSHKRLISNGQAKNYYNIFQKNITEKGCSVKEVKCAPCGDSYGAYYPKQYLIEVQENKSIFIMLIVLAHEFGHFMEYLTYFEHYGRNTYHRFIRKSKFKRADLILSEANAWITAEKELNKIDKDICLDYRFSRYRSLFMDDTIKEVYGIKKAKKK